MVEPEQTDLNDPITFSELKDWVGAGYDTNHKIVSALMEIIAELKAENSKLREALGEIVAPSKLFTGPECCRETFSDTCELFSDLARSALNTGEKTDG